MNGFMWRYSTTATTNARHGQDAEKKAEEGQGESHELGQTCRAVEKMAVETGEVVQRHSSIEDACNEAACGVHAMKMRIKRGTNREGYMWRFSKDAEKKPEEIEDLKVAEEIEEAMKGEGDDLDKWNNWVEAANKEAEKVPEKNPTTFIPHR